MGIAWDWVGSKLNVKVLFSVAGVATQILVQDKEEDHFLLLDVGDGVIRDLLALPGRVFEKIDAFVITHGHYDHMGGVFSLLSIFKLIKRTKELYIISPPDNNNLKHMVDFFITSNQSNLSFPINYIETMDSSINLKSFILESFSVKHRSSSSKNPMKAVGYKISKKDETILYTGDTGYFSDLEILVKDVDLALIETTFVDKNEDYHLNLSEAKKLADLAHDYIFIHVPTHVYFSYLKEKNG